MEKMCCREHVKGLSLNKGKGITFDIRGMYKEGQKGMFLRFWKSKRLKEFLS